MRCGTPSLALHPSWLTVPTGWPHPECTVGTVQPIRSLEPCTDVGWRMLSALGGGKKAPGVWGEELRRGCTVSCLHLCLRQRCQPGCPGHRGSVPRHGLQEGFCKCRAGSSPPQLGAVGERGRNSLFCPMGSSGAGLGARRRGQHSSYHPSPLFPGASAAAALPPAAPCLTCLSFPPQHSSVALQGRGSLVRACRAGREALPRHGGEQQKL